MVDACETELAAVQAKCANAPFVQYIGGLCSGVGRPPSCVAACLSTLETSGSCAEINCYFCPVCDCAVPTVPSPFLDCLIACQGPSTSAETR